MLSIARKTAARGECSTPFGITEVGMPASIARFRDFADVLNAFRHHRGGHVARLDQTDQRLQVLNAFRHHRGGHAVRRSPQQPMNRSAQRLSASQRWASSSAACCAC